MDQIGSQTNMISPTTDLKLVKQESTEDPEVSSSFNESSNKKHKLETKDKPASRFKNQRRKKIKITSSNTKEPKNIQVREDLLYTSMDVTSIKTENDHSLNSNTEDDDVKNIVVPCDTPSQVFIDVIPKDMSSGSTFVMCNEDKEMKKRLYDESKEETQKKLPLNNVKREIKLREVTPETRKRLARLRLKASEVSGQSDVQTASVGRRAILVKLLDPETEQRLSSLPIDPQFFERSSHPTRAQVDVLLDFLEKNPMLTKGFPKCPSARDAAQRYWQRLAAQLNGMGGSAKSWKQWTKYWSDKKSAVKKKATQRSPWHSKIDGARTKVVKLSDVEKRIITIMCGKSFSTGSKQPIHTLSEAPQSMEESSTLPESVLPEPATHRIVSTQTESTESPRIPPIEHDESLSKQKDSPMQASSDFLAPTSHSSRQLSISSRSRLALTKCRSHLTSITDRFLRLEEQRLQLDRRNTRLLETVIENNANQMERLHETNSAVAQALSTIGEGLKMIAEQMKNK